MAAKRSAHSLLSKETMEPVAACSAYFMSSLTLSLCNKLVFSGADFDYPFAVLAFQSMCSVVFILVPGLLGCSENVRLSRSLFIRMIPVTATFGLMLWTSSKALRFCSMPLFTVFKNLAVLGTTAYEWARFGVAVSRAELLSMALMLLGSALTGSGDMSATPEGLFWMMSNILLTVAYLAVMKELMPSDASSSAKALHNNSLTCALFLAVSAAAGDLEGFTRKLPDQSRAFQAGLLATGLLGTALNMSTFWALQVTNAGTYAFVGAINKIPLAILGHILFHTTVEAKGWAGVSTGLLAGIIYAAAKERKRQRAEAEDDAAQKLSLVANSKDRDARFTLQEEDEDGEENGGQRHSTRV